MHDSLMPGGNGTYLSRFRFDEFNFTDSIKNFSKVIFSYKDDPNYITRYSLFQPGRDNVNTDYLENASPIQDMIIDLTRL